MHISNPHIFSVHFVPSLSTERWYLLKLDTFDKTDLVRPTLCIVNNLACFAASRIQQNWIRREIMSPRPLVVIIGLKKGVCPESVQCEKSPRYLGQGLVCKGLPQIISNTAFWLLYCNYLHVSWQSRHLCSLGRLGHRYHSSPENRCQLGEKYLLELWFGDP